MEGEKMTVAIPAIVTLMGGIVIGYLGQRCGMCLVSGMRDFYMFRDTWLVKAVIGLFVGSFGSFLIFGSIGGFAMPDYPLFWDIGSVFSVVIVAMGGLGLGFFSVLADGCPFRQFVMVSEGRKIAIAYLAGFFAGIAYFQLILGVLITMLHTIIG